MSLRYLWNKLEKMNSLEQECYIKNIFIEFDIDPIYPIEDNFKDTPGKQSLSKNPLGYLVMHLDERQLQHLLPIYSRALAGFDTFNLEDTKLIQDVHKLVNEESITIYPQPDKTIMLEVFEFGRYKYSDWSFLDLDPMTLIPAFFRHCYKHKYMSYIDEETGLPHHIHAACNARMIELIRSSTKEIDDGS